MSYELSGKTIVVTGGTSGIGLAVVKELAASGAFVIGLGRSAKRNQQALSAVLAQSGLSNRVSEKVHYLLADLSQQSQVRRLGNKVKQKLDAFGYDHLDVLINNAGVYLEKKVMTQEGIEMTFAVNHLAHFLLTHELMPMLRRAEVGRVLTVSSYAHFTTPLTLSRIVDPWPYIGVLAYKRSKLCNILFTYEFNRRFDGVRAFVIDPGLVDTGIASKGSQGISDWVWRRRRKQGELPEDSVKIFLQLSAAEEIDTSGGYYYKDGKPKTPSRNARKRDLAESLWEMSCKLTGIDWQTG